MHKHTKHTRLVKRQTETYAPNEIAILGANCNVISNLVSAISNLLKNYKLAYLDASHAKDVQPISVSEYTFHHQGNVQISKAQPLNTYQQQLEFATYDFVFINGNHYTGKKQILILDPNKKASVLKRLEQLDNIQFVVKLDNSTPFFDFLEAKYPNISQKKCYHITNIVGIANHIHTLIKEKMAPIKGLVMAGGNSMRMGTDKTTLNYYNVPQKEYVKALLEAHNLETYYSLKNC
jgi:molybdenum cofactor guanylyltransferase